MMATFGGKVCAYTLVEKKASNNKDRILYTEGSFTAKTGCSAAA
jgi:hypothetical protein